ncbi:MAG: type I-D CRISPR-associated protein Cas10d/Csc3 [Coleofasciculus sp. G1-WW12-02]|uniref:type I-D CRISPR-associated protein Cas10d/Csc3 n=1 Tax=Coleofasciculus sp. G1-WW12-02 TaxID=3068483 RepID=UPI0032F20A2A
MTKKSQQFNQLSLFDITPEPDDDWLDDDDLGFDTEPSNRTVETPQSLLTLTLLREAIQAQNPDDPVIRDFGEYVLPNLLQFAIGVTAKGGKFFDHLDQQREAAGKEKVRRDNAADQSLNTHLLNGLFPANLIEQRLEKLDTTIKRVVGERERRLVIAAFILHDFEKFPDVPKDCRKLPLEQHRQIIGDKVCQLGLDYLINPENPDTYSEYIDDLLIMAYNAQRRWDTNWNFSEYGLNPVLRDRTLRCLSDLTCLADSLASIVKHPQDAEHPRLQELIHSLSDGQLTFTYHSIAENRGVLTNVVNNALIQVYQTQPEIAPGNHCPYEPLLYLPTGVIYLAHRHAPEISLDGLPDRVVATIKSLCREQLRLRQTGFGRDGKGMKYADYYQLFFDESGLMNVALDATLRILNPNKPSVAKSRSDNLIKFQQQGILSADYDFKFGDDIRIDQLAEFGDLVSRKIWGERVSQIEAARKQDKQLPELPHLDLIHKLAEYWHLGDYLSPIREIQQINQQLKQQKLKGNTGGVPYPWYFLAAKYLQKNPGIETIRETGEELIAYVTELIQPLVSQYELPDGWDDLRLWLERVVMLPSHRDDKATVDVFLQEFASYQAAKKPGRGRQLICSISHSAYTVIEQIESAVLFTPQVYTNKQMLGGSNAKRNISSIAGIEMMLRQILMNQTQAVGKRFEDGKYRYLYFYPTYYFTPETNRFLKRAYSGIAQTRFNTQIRNHFISQELRADLSRSRYQNVDMFLIQDTIEPGRDRTFKLAYPDDQPMTFYFMAIPPGRDSTDTESWVMPSWLALAFPMILDVKTVVSESPIPPFTDGAAFEETVFLDSAPPAFRALVRRDRFRLDYILEGWTENGLQHPAPLNSLTAAYGIHLDVNAKSGKSGYDPNWGRLTELAKDFETSPLYVFSYLNRWVRSQSHDTAPLNKIRLYAYQFYPCFDPYSYYDSELEELIVTEQSSLNHPKRLMELYRQFYRANKRYNPKANAVLKPIDIAADTILKADSTVFHGETLVMAVAAEVFKLMDRVHGSTAEGRWVISNREKEREAILEFAQYFVVEVFEKSFSCDRARLAGRQINLIRDTCEFLYRLEDDKENRQRQEELTEDGVREG